MQTLERYVFFQHDITFFNRLNINLRFRSFLCFSSSSFLVWAYMTHHEILVLSAPIALRRTALLTIIFLRNKFLCKLGISVNKTVDYVNTYLVCPILYYNLFSMILNHMLMRSAIESVFISTNAGREMSWLYRLRRLRQSFIGVKASRSTAWWVMIWILY